ncbi:hypothetical protein AAMO2058_001124200 [Amorphochlora amoebiformis]
MEVECEGSPSSPILFEKIRLFGAGSRGKSKNRGTKKRKCDPLKKLSEKKSRRAGSRSKAGDDHCFTSSSSVEREVRTCLEILGDTTLHDPKMKSIQGSCKKDIPFAPTLTPSEEEFKDFYTYLSKISTEVFHRFCLSSSTHSYTNRQLGMVSAKSSPPHHGTLTSWSQRAHSLAPNRRSLR